MASLLRLFTLACVLIPLAQPDTVKKSALDKPTLETYVRHLFVWGPQIKVEVGEAKPSAIPGMLEVNVRASLGEAAQDELFYVSKDGQRIIRGSIYNVTENPFKPDLDKLKTDAQPNFGTPGAPVVMVLFSDFQCPYCKEEAKMLRANVLSSYPKEVRVYFKDFPLVQIHPWAKPAAITGRCIFKQNPATFWEYHDWIYDHQTDMTPENLRAKVMEFAQGKEIDALQLGRCMDTKATESEIDKSIAEAKELKINGTPTLFVNGRRLPPQAGWSDLRQVIDQEIDYQKVAKNAGEDCGCLVTLPGPKLK